MKLLITLITLLGILLPATVVTAGEAQQISEERMSQVLSAYLAEESERLPQVELRFAKLHLPKPFEVPAGEIEFQVIPAKPGVIGSRRLTLLTRVDGQVASNQSIRVDIEALAEIIIAAANLRRGEVLDQDDLVLQRQDISTVKQPLFSAAEILGKRLKRSVRLGQPVQRKQIDFPPLVARGERVTIKVSSGGLNLTASGEAQQDGRKDDTIRVMNSNSRKVILGRVVAPGLVTVEL